MVGRLVGAGRGLAIEPVFEPGPLLRLGRQGQRGRVGDLVTAVAGRGAPRIVAVHGPPHSTRAVMDALLSSEGLGRAFPRAVEDEAERAAAWAAVEDPGRRDLTAQRVITIDPEGAKDHDDAIAVAREGDGIRLWVHIADVARYVRFGGAIDREAARRGTSVYVPGTVDPMLPARLSNDVCSLRPGEDRKVVTVEMLVAPDGAVTSSRFFRAVVHSRRRLTYPEVDRLFGGGSLGDPGLEEDLRVARELSERLRARRMAAGALEIDSGEAAFTFDGDRVTGVHVERQTASHRLVEDCMIAANEAVARYMLDRGRPTVFRVHDDPAERSVDLLLARLAALGVAVPPMPEGPLTPGECARIAVAAGRAVRDHAAAHGGERALPVLVLQALRQAHYSAERCGHSGLASPAYLHFTSPIRRYPDLVAHRALLDALGLDDPGADAAGLAEAAETSSIAERQATDVERRADRICLAFLAAEAVEDDPGRVFPAEVTGAGEGGVFCAFGPGLAYDGYLPARSIPGDWWTQDPLGVMLVGEESGRRICVGDRIDVRVADVQALRGRVELALPEAHPPRTGRPGPLRRGGGEHTRVPRRG